MADQTLTVGKTEKRKDARDKVTGAAQYVADITAKKILHGALVRSKHHFARINTVQYEDALKSSGVLQVLTSKDIPGIKTYGPLIHDQTPLALDMVRHLGEPIALVIANTLEQARTGAALVQVDYQELTPVFDPEEALAPGAPDIHPDGNLAAHFDVLNGDVDKCLDEDDFILE